MSLHVVLMSFLVPCHSSPCRPHDIAPVLFIAVGSQANIGGAASAPIVASAVHPKLAPVGVLLAVLGYALGTYAAWLCAVLMQLVAPV